MKRTATALWNGTGKEGSGTLTTESKVLNQTSYSHRTRFTDVEGTSPEELIAAAHAGCYSMKLGFVIVAAGATPEKIETVCTVTIESGTITNSHLVVKASVAGATSEQFQTWAEEAKSSCPVSKALNTNVTLEASLA